MIIPIYIAYIAHNDIDDARLSSRLDTLLEFLHLDDGREFVVHQLRSRRSGLIFIERRQSLLRVPLAHHTERRMTVSAYTPFGATQYADKTQLYSGEYLPQLVEKLRTTPRMLRHMAPPLVLCDLDLQSKRLSIVNDYRGFGRLYQYSTPFGTIWTNKMAAALLLAGVPARLDEQAWAELAATGMFFGASTGYAHMSYAAPGSLMTANIDSGLTEYRRLSTDTCGIGMALNPPDAAEKAHDAIRLWCRELLQMTGGANQLYLSGGRDSRVVASHFLAEAQSETPLEIFTFSPPNKDAELARTLLENCKHTFPLTTGQRANRILGNYKKEQKELTTISEKLLRQYNTDIAIASVVSTGLSSVSPSPFTLFIGGAQGEIAHNCYYTAQVVAAEQHSRHEHQEDSPAAKRLLNFIHTISTKAWGISRFSQEQTLQHIKDYSLSLASSADITGLYCLDFLYLNMYLNRQWGGANGNEDIKTPLTVYPYVRYGFSQTPESKLNSSFIRDVITLAQPQWRNIPFFHELPREEQQDFVHAYPTYWEMERGEELQEICLGIPELWQYFDRDIVISTFARLLATRGKAPEINTRQASQCHRIAQRMLWYCAALTNLQKINLLIAHTK